MFKFCYRLQVQKYPYQAPKLSHYFQMNMKPFTQLLIGTYEIFLHSMQIRELNVKVKASKASIGFAEVWKILKYLNEFSIHKSP